MTIDDDALGGPYRAVRVIRAREDGPWPGVLVRTTTGDARVLVDVGTLGPDWVGWDAAPGGHVLGPLDLSRRVDGHDAVLPVCVERLEEFLRRRAARMPLSPGEAVTLGVSVLRGCAQLVATPDVAGEWWLDDAGRPVLATDASARRAVDAAAEALEQVAVAAPLQRTWDTAVRAVTAERLSTSELTSVEDALFALAAPEPLTTVSLTPRSAMDERVDARESVDGLTAMPTDPQPRSLWHSLVAGVDDDLADTVSKVTTAAWRRLRAPHGTRRSGRRAPWLVGGAAATVVLIGGALWPTASGVATSGSATPTPYPTPTPDAAQMREPSAPAVKEDGVAESTTSIDLVAVTGALLDDRLACADDAGCLTTVVVDPSSVPNGGAIDLAADERSIALLDDFGDLAVLRVDGRDATSGSQLVVIVRQDEEWLLRDVHDVAQQP